MKLRNKKTGEIGYLIVGRGSDHYVVANNEWDSCGKYDSLAELNEEWKDYEEPKEDYIRVIDSFIHYVEEADESFECDESVHKFIEKLKAWRRLTNKGFRFSGFAYTELKDYARVNIRATMINDSINEDLNLLFGGEE